VALDLDCLVLNCAVVRKVKSNIKVTFANIFRLFSVFFSTPVSVLGIGFIAFFFYGFIKFEKSREHQRNLK
jgi:hypothetical protein